MQFVKDLRSRSLSEGDKMNQIEFLQKANEEVRKLAEKHYDKTEALPEFETFIIWNTYTAGLSRALLSTTLPDTKYYEAIYTVIGGMTIIEYIKTGVTSVRLENE